MVLSASCPRSVVVKYYGELQTQNQSPLHSPGLGGGGSGQKWLVHKGKINYAHQPFVTTPQPGKWAVSHGVMPGTCNQKSKSLPPPLPPPPPPPPPAMWAVVTNECIRRCRAYPNDVPLVYIWPSPRENLSSEVCKQQRCRPASDQRLCYSLLGKHHI